jgi:hypothetical protein
MRPTEDAIRYRLHRSDEPAMEAVNQMDDQRIRELTDEVLRQVRGGGSPGGGGDLESRVRSLEAAVSRLERERGQSHEAAPAVHVHTHPSLQLLNVPSGIERCVMEPDRPCVKSGACRTFGH